MVLETGALDAGHYHADLHQMGCINCVRNELNFLRSLVLWIVYVWIGKRQCYAFVSYYGGCCA